MRVPPVELRTPRLTLRSWRADDLEPFAAMNADPVVMEHFPSTLSREQSDAFVERIQAHFEQRGFGLWAVDVDGLGFVGFTGLAVPRFRAEWMTGRPQPVVEVGWRLRRDAWGSGYATEAARAALAFGFGQLALEEVVSFTLVGNLRSQAVMRRLGLTRLAFYDHPVEGRAPMPSVVYVLRRENFGSAPD